MHDDPRKNLQWLQQQLLEEEAPANASFFVPDEDDVDLITRNDILLEEDPDPSPVTRRGKRLSTGQRIQQARQNSGVEEDAAVFTQTRKQLRREAKRKKKANVNRKLADLVFLALLEIIGILCILGWWLQ